MNTFLDMLSLGFMQRAFISGALLAVLFAVLGVLITLRRMAFLGEGIAHASLAGIAIAILTHTSPLPLALIWGIGIAVSIFLLERKTKLPVDTTIGILFTASLAVGVVLMSLTEGYQPELLTYLFGSILGIQTTDIIILAVLTAGILSSIGVTFRSLILMSLNEDSAKVQGIRTDALTLVLYVLLAVAMVLGVKMLGVILVSALLIIPAATGRIVSQSLAAYISSAVVAGLLSVLVGLTVSYLYDIPSGATIVLTSTSIFFLAVIGKKT